MVILGIFVNRLGGFLHAFLVLFLVHDGYGSVQAGAALGANGVGSIAGVLLGGWLVGTVGARSAITWSMTLTAVLTAAVPMVHSYPLMLVVITALGASSQVYRPASAEVVSTGVPPQRQVMAFAMHRLALNLGTTVAPLLGAVLVAVSYDLLFWVEAIAALACAVISWRALPSPGHRRGHTRSVRSGGAGYVAVLRDTRYLLFLLGMALYAAVYIQYVSVLPLTVRDAEWSTYVYGGLIGVNGLVVISCELLVTRWTQHWPGRVAAVCGIAMVAGGVAMYAVPPHLAIFVMATVIWSLGETVCSPTMVAYPALMARPGMAGHYIGASQAAFGMGTALGPALGVAMWSAWGDTVWLLLGALALVAAAAVGTGMRNSRETTVVGGPEDDGTESDAAKAGV
ncbi:MFS transporter [Streptomyces sp. PKU-MA01144]|uniref:MFS transporter n=1 Tax=Streptomyces sp. PKU-MA01144 TaxID=2729138 RepID=UPI00147EB180|nr:MFS transporter [Streptomyces sp. PKU-MA01144]NNJ03354.1 MFS transporter [Streptomyces sp. PKU-MA01144]